MIFGALKVQFYHLGLSCFFFLKFMEFDDVDL